MRDLDRYQSEYVATYGFEAHMVRYRRRQVLKCLRDYSHRHVLEVSCGLDPLAHYVDDWDTYIVVEPGATFAANARELASKGKPFVVHEATIEQAATVLTGQHFDFIVVSGLIHEVVAPQQVLGAVRTLCDDDTIVHVNVPNARSLHNRLGLRMGLIPDLFALSPLAERLQRKSTFDLRSLSDFVRQAGFEVDSSGSYFLKPFTHEQMQQMLDQGVIDVRVLDALFDVNEEFSDLGAEIFVNLKRR